MAVESGKDGKILIGATPIAEIKKWTLDKKAHVSRWGSSSSAGYKKAVAGVKEGSGSIEFVWDAAAASPIAEGTSATLLLYLNASEFYSVPAIIENFKLAVDMNDGPVTEASADFVNNGAWTEPTLS